MLLSISLNNLLGLILLAGLVTSLPEKSVWSQCPSECSGGSCCQVGENDWSCCPYVNGMCCMGGEHCCPQGSICSPTDSGVCKYTGGLVFGSKRLWKPKKDTPPSSSVPEQKTAPVICPDRKSACPTNTTCCPMSDTQFGCCNSPNAVCCSDRVHCCPEGSQCDSSSGTCLPSTITPSIENAPFHGSKVWPNLQKPFNPSDIHRLYANGVVCEDHVHECPPLTTCCKDAAGQMACCPMPEAVCCSDGVHCCPKDTICDVHTEQCVSGFADQPPVMALLPSKEFDSQVQLCPDGVSRCLDDDTCCRLADKKTWGCCPVPEAVCCIDGEHCCPKGYQCDGRTKTCSRSPFDSQAKLGNPSPMVRVPPSTEPTSACPNPEFRCDNSSTCCPLANDEWACCPFKNAVCCSDQGHCCPEGTTCNLEKNRCEKADSSGWLIDHPITSSSSSFSNKADRPDGSMQLCQDGRSACPESKTCCLNAFGFFACCPFENAVCCADRKHCCPSGTQCMESSGRCIPETGYPSVQNSIPWLRKQPALRTLPENSGQVQPTDVKLNSACPDERYECEGKRTCCPLAGGAYGCCPLDDGVCCPDQLHCCPHGSSCGSDGMCFRERKPKLLGRGAQQAPRYSEAYKMVPTARPLPTASQYQGDFRHRINPLAVRSQWCGDRCQDGWFCCPDATNTGLTMCCPAAAGTCCSDGEHCCPKGSRCLAGGRCEAEDRFDTYLAPYLIPPIHREKGTQSQEFLPHINPQPIRNFATRPSVSPKPSPQVLLDMLILEYRRGRD